MPLSPNPSVYHALLAIPETKGYSHQISILKKLLDSSWSNISGQVHQQIGDVRMLIDLLGCQYLEEMDDLTVEIETISGIALGLEQHILSISEREQVLRSIQDLKCKLNELATTQT